MEEDPPVGTSPGQGGGMKSLQGQLGSLAVGAQSRGRLQMGLESWEAPQMPSLPGESHLHTSHALLT